MALIALSAPLINWLSEIEPKEWLVGGGPWKIATAAGAYLMAANLFAHGASALLAGIGRGAVLRGQ